MTSYLVSVASFAVIYGLLAVGLSVQWGMAGLVNFGQVAFFAIGAYVYAIATLAGWHPVTAMAAAVVVAGVMGAGVAGTTLRLRRDFLALVTLGFGEVVRLFVTNEAWLTGGASGLPGVPRLFPASPGPWGDLPYLLFLVGLSAVVLVIVRMIQVSPFGRVLSVIREDETVATFLGRNVFKFKIQAFAIGAGIGGLAGCLFVQYISLAVPEQFLPVVTIYAWIAVMLGGQKNPPGAFIGASCMMLLLETTRFAKDYVPWIQSEQLAAGRIVLVGVLLILLVKCFPNGVFVPKEKN